MSVTIQELKRMAKRRYEINSTPLRDLYVTNHGVKVEFTDEMYDSLECNGLNNIDNILIGYTIFEHENNK